MVQQQVIISGVGGQGVLFVTRLLAEAAIRNGLAVLTSETHGMAQRGGTVISHLKVGDFSSVLIRSRQADGLLVLRENNLKQHGHYLKSGGWTVVNGGASHPSAPPMHRVDADRLAVDTRVPRSVNLVLLGYALGLEGRLFCCLDDIQSVLSQRLSHKKSLLEGASAALQAGFCAAGSAGANG